MSFYWHSHFIFFSDLLSTVLTLIPLLIAVAFFTLAERKIMASIQRRRGPNTVGFLGILQPIADGLKLIIKEIVLPKKVNSTLFIIAPFLTFFVALIGWAFIPFSFMDAVVDINLGCIYILTVLSFGVYGVFLAG
jgi:NADH-quinone oxidoreductase subunit H